MHKEPIRVAAVDDHPVVLRGLQAAAKSSGGEFEFVGTAGTVSELLLGDPCAADVVLLDLHLRDSSRPGDNVRALREGGYLVLVYTEGSQPAWVADAMRAGAQGVVTKAEPEHELLAAIRCVHSGGTVLSAEMAHLLHLDARLRPQLAPREAEALRLVARGLADKQVARLMGISEETVKEYLKRVRQKYAAQGRPAGSRVELSRRAVEDGFFDGE